MLANKKLDAANIYKYLEGLMDTQKEKDRQCWLRDRVRLLAKNVYINTNRERFWFRLYRYREVVMEMLRFFCNSNNIQCIVGLTHPTALSAEGGNSNMGEEDLAESWSCDGKDDGSLVKKLEPISSTLRGELTCSKFGIRTKSEVHNSSREELKIKTSEKVAKTVKEKQGQGLSNF
jgi:hypothetical protein